MEIEVNSEPILGRLGRLLVSTCLDGARTLYFFTTTCVYGFPMSLFLVIPLSLIGRWSRPVWRLAGRVQVSGVTLLMRAQPWVKWEAAVSAPGSFPNEGYFTVSNHRSHLDMFFLLATVPNIRAIAKDSLFKVPFLGIMLKVMRMIPVKRGDLNAYWTSMEAARSAIAAGDPVHVFPEMTRCPLGATGTQPFQLLPFRVAHESQLIVVPIVLLGTDRAWPKGQSLLKGGARVKVKSLPPIHSKDFKSASALRDEVRRQIDEELRANGS